MRRTLRKHRYTIAFGIPIFFTYLANAHLMPLPENILTIQPNHTPFVQIDDSVTLDIAISASEKINVLGSTLTYPINKLSVKEIRYNDSPINLWIQKPKPNTKLGIVPFSGGIITEDDAGFVGTSTMFHITFNTKNTGIAPLHLEGSLILAHNGNGTNILTGTKDLSIYIRPKNSPSPDINQDGRLTASDVSNVYTHTFGDYDKRYDINNDGTVTIDDAIALYRMLP